LIGDQEDEEEAKEAKNDAEEGNDTYSLANQTSSEDG